MTAQEQLGRATLAAVEKLSLQCFGDPMFGELDDPATWEERHPEEWGVLIECGQSIVAAYIEGSKSDGKSSDSATE